jgi:hypothetical protein
LPEVITEMAGRAALSAPILRGGVRARRPPNAGFRKRILAISLTMSVSLAYVGMDVAKATLDLHAQCQPHPKTHQFPNDRTGHRALVAWLRKLGPVRVVCEATGGYERADGRPAFRTGGIFDSAEVIFWSETSLKLPANAHAKGVTPPVVSAIGGFPGQ